jgi:hypothetical protein
MESMVAASEETRNAAQLRELEESLAATDKAINRLGRLPTVVIQIAGNYAGKEISTSTPGNVAAMNPRRSRSTSSSDIDGGDG